MLSLIEINPADLLFGRYRIAHENLILDGLFLRGESDIALLEVSDDSVGRRKAASGKAATMRIAADIGWRVRLSERLTGSAAYGLRATLPQTLWNSDSKLTQRWVIQKSDNPDARVQINLGFLL